MIKDLVIKQIQELKAYEGVFWLSGKSKTWHDIQYLYKRNNIIVFIIFFREN